MQFNGDGVRAGVQAVIAVNPEIDPWERLSILTEMADGTDGETETLLEQLDDPDATRQACRLIESFGVHAFTRALATNLADKGIRVNAVAPGPVWTPLNPADQPASNVADFGSGTDMGRPAQPEELSPAFVFLASPVCSSYITGVVLPVMGGVTAIA